jgi:hypothetical protein
MAQKGFSAEEAPVMPESRLKRDVAQLISENGLKSVIGELARYCHSPPSQIYPWQVMQTMFNRLNKLYEYLDGKSQ